MSAPPPPKKARRTPRRVVDEADILDWLPDHHGLGPVAVVLPDRAEVGMSVTEWHDWFRRCALACARTADGPVVFHQTDRMTDGIWVDKADLVTDSLAFVRSLLWHKIVLRRDPGKNDLHRPTYSHLLAYGPPGRPGKRRPDVIHAGPYLWRNGIGLDAARFVVDYLAEQGASAIVNPCCGEGTLLVAANQAGLDAYGCDTDPDRVAAARTRDTV